MSESSMPLPGRLPDTAAQDARADTFGNIVEILHDWVTTVDHKKIGILYILYSLMMLVAGGIEILLIRLQLAGPRSERRSRGSLQSSFHNARHHNDLLRGDADLRGLRQLSGPA